MSRMTDSEREEILARLAANAGQESPLTFKALANELGRAPSTLCALDRKRRGLERVRRKPAEQPACATLAAEEPQHAHD